jgi:hypothetical protein
MCELGTTPMNIDEKTTHQSRPRNNVYKFPNYHLAADFLKPQQLQGANGGPLHRQRMRAIGLERRELAVAFWNGVEGIPNHPGDLLGLVGFR